MPGDVGVWTGLVRAMGDEDEFGGLVFRRGCFDLSDERRTGEAGWVELVRQGVRTLH
jgi:hypothetical protein